MSGKRDSTSHESVENIRGALIRIAAFHPGGVPRVIVGMLEVDVVTTPSALVKTIVVTVGTGVIAGKEVTFTSSFWPKIALYVLVARAEDIMPPVGALTDVLNP